MPDDPAKTTVHLPSTGSATVHGPATVEPEPGSSIAMGGWFKPFINYGFAGVGAFLLVWLSYNQRAMYDNLMAVREKDMQTHHDEIKEVQQIYRDELTGMRTRYDDVRKENRDNHLSIIKALGELKDEVNKLRWNAKGKLE